MSAPTRLTTFRNAAVSLWQSAVHQVLSRRVDPSDAQGLHLTAEHPAMGEAIDAGHADLGGAEDPHGVIGQSASLYARLAVARFSGDHEEAARLTDAIHFSVGDPLWAEILVQFERSRIEGRIDSYPRHQSLDDFVFTDLPDDVTLALVADWATGTASAQALLEQIKALAPDVVIHLGDVYFSGLPEEVQEHFLGVFKAVFGERMPRVFTLAGNHDRYSGGRGFKELLAELGQPASYFCLRNRRWQLLGMDTSLHDVNPAERRTNVTELEAGEVTYHLDKLSRSEGRGTVLLSHHQLFSAHGVGRGPEGRKLAVNPKLHGAFSGALAEVDWWFWGHEHNLSIFAPYAGLRRGRGIGSGSIPILVAERPYDPDPDLALPEGEAGPPEVLAGTELGHDGVIYNHAFVILRLSGGTATAQYYQSNTSGVTPGQAPPVGEPFYTEVVTRTA